MKIIITLIFTISVFIAGAQHIDASKVPSVVKEAFSKSHPGLKAMDWEMENGNYEVEYKDNKLEKSEVYDATGTLLESEVEIKVEELPAAVSQYISKNFAGQKIKEASKILQSSGMEVFEVEIEKTDYIFDGSGNLLKTEKDSGKEKDKE